MRKTICFIIGLATLTTANAQHGAEITTTHGYRFINHTNLKTTTPVFQDDIVADVQVYVGDSLMQSSKSFAPNGLELTLPSKEEFESSPSAPALMDAVLLMSPGDSATAYMKLDSFIKASLPPALRKHNEVRYEIKLQKVISGEEKRQAAEKSKAAFAEVAKSTGTTVAEYRNGALASKLTTLPSGLKYMVKDQGNGAPISEGEKVAVHYYGCLTNGAMFDNSFERGEALAFNAGIGQMIPGFDEGVMHLRHGAKAYLFIPSALGYGDQPTGSIPANSELVFYIEIQ